MVCAVIIQQGDAEFRKVMQVQEQHTEQLLEPKRLSAAHDAWISSRFLGRSPTYPTSAIAATVV